MPARCCLRLAFALESTLAVSSCPFPFRLGPGLLLSLLPCVGCWNFVASSSVWEVEPLRSIYSRVRTEVLSTYISLMRDSDGLGGLLLWMNVSRASRCRCLNGRVRRSDAQFSRSVFLKTWEEAWRNYRGDDTKSRVLSSSLYKDFEQNNNNNTKPYHSSYMTKAFETSQTPP